jgi:hypothetical protein
LLTVTQDPNLYFLVVRSRRLYTAVRFLIRLRPALPKNITPLGFIAQNPNSVVGTTLQFAPSEWFLAALRLFRVIDPSHSVLAPLIFLPNRSKAGSNLGCEEWREEYDHYLREATPVLYVILSVGDRGWVI